MKSLKFIVVFLSLLWISGCAVGTGPAYGYPVEAVYAEPVYYRPAPVYYYAPPPPVFIGIGGGCHSGRCHR